jgi:hypothetical protein
MKKQFKIYFLLVLLLICIATTISCSNKGDYRGIISNVESTEITTVKYESLKARYIHVAFEITIDNPHYIGKELEIVAMTDKEEVLYRETCVFDETQKTEIFYREYCKLIEFNSPKIKTKSIVILDGETVVGSAKIDEFRPMVILFL